MLSKSQLANVAKQKLIAGSAAHNLAIKKELQIESELLAARVASHSIQLQNLRTIWVAKGKSLVLANAELVAAKSKLASITAETSATQVAIIQQRVANAQTKVNTLTTEKNALAKSIKGKITQRNTAATALDSHVTRLDTTVKIANTNATNFLTAAKKGLIFVSNKLKATLANNPYTIAAVAIAAMAFGIYKLLTAETALEKTERELAEAIKATREQNEQYISNTDSLISAIQSTTNSVYEQVVAYEELIKQSKIHAKFSQKEIANFTPEQNKKVRGSSIG